MDNPDAASDRPPFPVDHTFSPLQPGALLGSMIHFRAIIDLLVEALQPKVICEIGVQSGVVTQRLVSWAREHRASYIGVDPVISPRVRKALGEDDCVTLYAEKSLEVLPRLPMPDLTVIDGDHNYYTVHGELSALVAAWDAAGRKPFAILMHDTSWPWARRDAYYAPAAIPEAARRPIARRGGASVRSEKILPWGHGAKEAFAVAEPCGGPRNGVLTALEDVIGARPDLAVAHVPAAFGLSIIYPADLGPPRFAEAIGKLTTSLSVLGELLAGVEYARLLAYEMYQKDERLRIFKRLGHWIATPWRNAKLRRRQAQID